MPIDPTLAQGLQPIQIAPPDNTAKMNQLALLMRMQGLQSDNQLNQFKLQTAQQAVADQNALRAALAGGNLGDPAFQSKIIGMPGGADALKSYGEAQKAATEGKVKAAELVDKRLALYGDAAKQAADLPALETIIKAKYNDDVLSPILKSMFPVDLALASIRATAKDPNKGFEYAKQSASNLTYKDLLEAQAKIKDLQLQERTAATGESNAATAAARLKFEQDKTTFGQEHPTLSYQDTPTGAVSFNPQTGAVTPLEVGGKPIPPKVGAESLSPLGKLARERAALPPGDPRIAEYDAAIKNETQSNMSKLDERTKAAFDKAYPKATASLKSFDAETDDMLKTIDALAEHPGTERITGGPGGINAYTPNVTENARNAQALLDRLGAMGQFKALTDMRQNSPTGGALGNVSDFEGRTLRDSFAALQRTQGTPAFKSQLSDLKSRLMKARENVHSAYEDTYSYKNEPAPSDSTTKTPAGASVSNW